MIDALIEAVRADLAGMGPPWCTLRLLRADRVVATLEGRSMDLLVAHATGLVQGLGADGLVATWFEGDVLVARAESARGDLAFTRRVPSGEDVDAPPPPVLEPVRAAWRQP